MPKSQALRQPALSCGGYSTPNNGVADWLLGKRIVRTCSEVPHKFMHLLALGVQQGGHEAGHSGHVGVSVLDPAF